MLQNPNFVTSTIELETDDDETEDGSNVTTPSLSVYSSTAAKTFSHPPANSFATPSNFLLSSTQNVRVSSNLDFLPPSSFTLLPLIQLTVPSSTYNPSIPNFSCSSRAHSATPSSSHQRPMTVEEV
jgi:hypothetical protein